MIINLHNLKNLPVFTQSGIMLGQIDDLNIQIEDHYVKNYQVSSGFFRVKKYLIKPEQIVEINKEKIVVEDAVIKETSQEEVKAEPAKALAGMAMTEE